MKVIYVEEAADKQGLQLGNKTLPKSNIKKRARGMTRTR